ncbi:MAG TPA: enoyl-CoA hydratase-related protein, partial [Acidimicrobiales bacterium]|nr:enoyl-CoA hydratase-related protein [Acidimicrobiales bacterium]
SEIGFETAGFVGILRVGGAPLSARAARELDGLLEELEADRSLRVLVLDSAGPDFCPGAGADLDPRGGGVDPPGRMEALRVPVVAAIGGRCASVGTELVLAADVRVAAPAAAISLGDVAGGGFPRWGGIQRLARAAGTSLATAMVLLGREVTGAEAHQAGLVHELADNPSDRSREVATTLAERGPLALEYAKEAVRRGAELPLHDALRLEADFNHLLAGSQDRAEGLAAFFDKRPPRFEGR